MQNDSGGVYYYELGVTSKIGIRIKKGVARKINAELFGITGPGGLGGLGSLLGRVERIGRVERGRHLGQTT